RRDAKRCEGKPERQAEQRAPHCLDCNRVAEVFGKKKKTGVEQVLHRPAVHPVVHEGRVLERLKRSGGSCCKESDRGKIAPRFGHRACSTRQTMGAGPAGATGGGPLSPSARRVSSSPAPLSSF